MVCVDSVSDMIITGDLKSVRFAVRDALEQGADVNEILESMTDAIEVVGERFEANELFVPEMLISALTVKRGIEELKPALSREPSGIHGKVIIGTVKGDLHDVGKNLVATMLEASGFEIVDLGVNVSAEQLEAAYREHPDTRIIALSTLLTTTLASMGEIVKQLLHDGIVKNVKIMVGGAPVTAGFAKKIGADAYTADAVSATKTAKELIRRR